MDYIFYLRPLAKFGCPDVLLDNDSDELCFGCAMDQIPDLVRNYVDSHKDVDFEFVL